jgi:hypothetical protein
MKKVLEIFSEAKFFIYNPNSTLYGYKFEYGSKPSGSKVILKKFEAD